MKRSIITIIVATTGLLTLYFFPEPQENFILYSGTMLAFLIATGTALYWQLKKTQ